MKQLRVLALAPSFLLAALMLAADPQAMQEAEAWECEEDPDACIPSFAMAW